ncbi:MAG: pyruvate synthase subunit beta [Candidatus Aenigmatarchaeota archaeon]|nr:MAG: pyruvate synthase subunit beta [Candidatus Aenigmarchaeota archaeon]
MLAPGHTLCAGCGIGVVMSLLKKVCPKDVIVSMATGCLEVCTTAYPRSAWECPAIHVAFECTSAVASGIEAAVRKLGKPWKVLAIAGDGGTFDIGFQALSGMLERGHKVTQICLDNEAYMNTGIQRSGGTPKYAETTTSPAGRVEPGKLREKKPLVDIVAAHRIPYAATASPGYPSDLVEKFRKALELQPSFLHILIPCPTGWRFDPSQTVRIARLAVDCGIWPLYEIENQVLRITHRPSFKGLEEYLGSQGRFKHLKPEQVEEIRNRISQEWERLEKIEKLSIS